MASPAQMDRDRMGLDFSGNRRRTNDSASFANFLDSKPKQTNDSASFANFLPQKTTNDSASFANFIGNQQSGGDNSGIQAFQQTQQGGSGGGSGSNIAQQVLGDAYGQAIALGYNPSELINMVTKAQSYNRGIDVDKFKTGLDRFEAFQKGGPGTQFDGQTFLSVSRPELTANAPTLAQLLGDIGGGISDMVGAGADFVLGGGTTGAILQGIKNQFNQGKDFVGEMINPGDISQRLDAAGPEARRKYALFLSQGDPYQVAFQKATGQAFAHGGVANL